ncbi:MAG TPA: SPFH domain-containing protein, partial [Niastella sp.]
MALIIIGFVIFLIGLAVARNQDNFRRFAAPVRILGAIVILIGIITSCIIQIDAGEVGVKKLFGKVQNDVLTSGLHFINPLLDVEKMDVKTQNYTMSGVHDEGQKSGDDAIRALTADGLEVVIDLTVLYRVLPTDAPRIVRETGLDFTSKVVRPVTRTKIRDNAVYYEA